MTEKNLKNHRRTRKNQPTKGWTRIFKRNCKLSKTSFRNRLNSAARASTLNSLPYNYILIYLLVFSLHIESPTSSLPSINVRTDIRASFLVFGPLLARTGKAEVYKPGGCDIQKEPRKVDYHIQAMENMSVQENPSIKETKIFVKMEVENGLKPAAITFKKSSVGATETAMMAASLVEGTLCVCVWSTSLIKMVKHLTIGGGNFLPTQLIHDHLST